MLQVETLPIDETDACLRIYNQLKEKGYMVYYRKLRRDRLNWMWIISVGMFKRITQAQEFRQHFEKIDEKGGFIDGTQFFVDAYQEDFIVITTPSTIWLKRQENYTELFRIEPKRTTKYFHPNYNQAVISPDGNQIVFYYNSQILKVKINTGKLLFWSSKTKHPIYLILLPGGHPLVSILHFGMWWVLKL